MIAYSNSMHQQIVLLLSNKPRYYRYKSIDFIFESKLSVITSSK